MNSIELVFNVSTIKQSGVVFNPNIGLGTEFPGGEEIHFLLDAYERGARFKLIHQTFVYHSCLEGGRRKTESDSIMQIRGATASRLGLLGWPLLFRWCIRYLMRDKRLSVVTSLLSGFFKGYKRFL